MTCNYQVIREDNQRRYGTDIGRIGPILLANRYDNRTHFIFELLQNAEDALARRGQWNGSRAVKFNLRDHALYVSHYGKPFDEADVRGICGIAESTKDLTDIGRFGIGFKSVYACTDRPEIHSGTEDFAIENFVWPVAVPPIQRDENETVIIIPLKNTDTSTRDEVAGQLKQLGARVLLFLRQIEEISWSVEGETVSGLYFRKSTPLDANVRRVTVIGQERGMSEIEESWLVFAQPVSNNNGQKVGYVEIAFSLTKNSMNVQRLEHSPLVVFFPTILETHLGFLIQGPYRTTPSRDNVPKNDPWNQSLVQQTASLLVNALRWLRDHNQLDTTTLRCLPLDSAKFSEGSMFRPLFDATKEALSSEALLPRFDMGYVSGTRAKLARTQELRELFDPKQLGNLFGMDTELVWLSGDITPDRTPEVRQYLMRELGVTEVRAETILPMLDEGFLEQQSDAWISRLYAFLGRQSDLQERMANIPLIRLESGKHVTAFVNGQPQAFLPSAIETDFPTVRRAVCDTAEALKFLQSLGLTEPNPVDDVIRNVLPKYRTEEVIWSESDYEADMRRILSAFDTDSKSQREKLITALRETNFVKAIDAGSGAKRATKPGEVYLATERLKELFEGVHGVFLVDDSYACLRGEDMRELLEACGATRYLQPIRVDNNLSREQLSEIRRKAGFERASWESQINDVMLRGLEELLSLLPQLNVEIRRRKAQLLWESLADLESRRGYGVFEVEYRWSYSHESRYATVDAAFVRKLNATAWVPDINGELHRPEFVLFDSLGWKANPFLQSKIRFKPPVIEQLAREVGIEPGVIDLLKRLGVTSEEELRKRLGVEEGPKPQNENPPSTVDDAIRAILGAPKERHGNGETGGGTDTRGTGDTDAGTGGDRTGRHSAGRHESGSKRTTDSTSIRLFVSYVGVHPDEEERDPDGLDHAARMELENKAIERILDQEPQLRRTPTQNPGFDLFEPGHDNQPVRWIEVKALTGDLHSRPATLSRAQFDCAREHGDSYWLYIVEHAGTDAARIVRIQNPAGKARTFTFDHGWLAVAEM